MIFKSAISQLLTRSQVTGELIEYKNLTEVAQILEVSRSSLRAVVENSLRFGVYEVDRSLWVTKETCNRLLEARKSNEILTKAPKIYYNRDVEDIISEDSHSHSSPMTTNELVNKALSSTVAEV